MPEEVKEEEKEDAIEILAEIDKLLAEQVPDCGDAQLQEVVTNSLYTVDRVLGEQRKLSDEVDPVITSDSDDQTSSEEQKSAEKLLKKVNRKNVKKFGQ